MWSISPIVINPELVHVRTRYRAPQTNGVAERFIRSLKYEHLYRLEIASGHELAGECESFRQHYNQVRPHQALAYSTPEQAHLAEPSGPPTPVRNFRRTPLGSLQRILAETGPLAEPETPLAGESGSVSPQP